MGGHLLQRTGRTGLGGTGSPAEGVFGASCQANGGPSSSENRAHRPGGDGESCPGGVRSLLPVQWGAILAYWQCPGPVVGGFAPGTQPVSRAGEYSARCGVVWCGVVWCGVVWCGVVWCGVVWCAEGVVTRRQWPGCLPTGTGKGEGCVSKCALCASVLLYSRDLCSVALGRYCYADACAQSHRVNGAHCTVCAVLHHQYFVCGAALLGAVLRTALCVPRRTALVGSGQRKLVWCGVVWCGVVWCGVVWCGVVWCGVPKALLPKGKRPGCLPTGTGKRAGLCVWCARCA